MPAIPQNISDRAAAVQQTFYDRLNTIRASRDLTPEGRNRQMAQAYTQAMSDMASVKASWSSGSTETAQSLTRRVFGDTNTSGADAISVRDADDRASKLASPNEAADLMGRAIDNGDEVLARAIALRAFNETQTGISILGGNAWGDVLDIYTATKPAIANQIEQIAQAKRQSATLNVQAAFTFSIMRPSELDRMSDAAIASA